MAIDVWFVYVATVLALMITPGPSQLLMLSNSAAYGARRSLATAVGDLSANALQMLAAGLGLAAIVAASSAALAIVKWLGVAYLLWLGFRMLRSAGSVRGQARGSASLRRLWLQGFLTSAANPKAVVFFAALFPQFIDPSAPFWPQLAALSATYIVLDACFLSAYGFAAASIARRLDASSPGLVERVGGCFMILAALSLGLKETSAPSET